MLGQVKTISIISTCNYINLSVELNRISLNIIILEQDIPVQHIFDKYKLKVSFQDLNGLINKWK